MPREIDCPDCFFNENISECPSCKDGKITVYTQEELDKARAEQPLVAKYWYKMYKECNNITQKSIDKAVQEEREAIAKIADSYNTYPDLGTAIRARGERE